MTGVGEERRSNRAISVSSIIRRFNLWAIDAHNKDRKQQGKPPIIRLQGASKVQLYLNYLDAYFKTVDKGRKRIGLSNIKKIKERLSSSKASEKERNAMMKRFAKDMKRRRKINKAELAAGVEKPARVDGGIYLRIMTKKNNFEPLVDTEVLAREIKRVKKKLTSKQLKELTIAEKRKLLRQDEMSNIMRDPGRAQMGMKESEVKHIMPVSDSIKNAFDKQQEILDKEDNIDRGIRTVELTIAVAEQAE